MQNDEVSNNGTPNQLSSQPEEETRNVQEAQKNSTTKIVIFINKIKNALGQNKIVIVSKSLKGFWNSSSKKNKICHHTFWCISAHDSNSICSYCGKE